MSQFGEGVNPARVSPAISGLAVTSSALAGGPMDAGGAAAAAAALEAQRSPVAEIEDLGGAEVPLAHVIERWRLDQHRTIKIPLLGVVGSAVVQVDESGVDAFDASASGTILVYGTADAELDNAAGTLLATLQHDAAIAAVDTAGYAGLVLAGGTLEATAKRVRVLVSLGPGEGFAAAAAAGIVRPRGVRRVRLAE